MNIDKDLSYKEYVHRENISLRAAFLPELEFYAYIKAGDLEKVNELCEESFIGKEGLGVLSFNPLQNLRYHFAITAAMIARFCIEGGMEVSLAYSLSDFYIQKVDVVKEKEEIDELHTHMCRDYTKRMKQLRKSHIYSKQVAHCLDYIYDHMHTRITLAELAELVHCSPSYLSRIFHEQIGCSISKYIQQKKIETAQNMLIYSDFSCSEIASILAFPNQSYFTEVFGKATGTTPHAFRNENTRNLQMHTLK